MTEKAEVDLKCLLALTKSHDDLKHRVEHLESHMYEAASEIPPTEFSFLASFRISVPPQKQKAYLKQFRAELESVFKAYGCIRCEGTFTT